jgi:uroporphyrin-III C-methyltransferase/precorrin-2 dehydrogenase/sirohydrochlorin ferrochelatase
MGFHYPVVLDLDGRRCVVVGGGTVAEHKARGLLEAGAAVTVIAGEVTDGIAALCARGNAAVVARPYAEGDLAGAFLVIAATDDPSVNARVHAEAKQRAVLLNAVDDAAHCDFAAPSVLRRGDLTIAVSTSGQAPALARRVRELLEGRFGPEWGTLVEVLAGAREAVGPRTVDFPTWAARWGRALDHDLPGMIRAGDVAGAGEVVRRTLAGEPPSDRPGSVPAPGRVAIVGAGPGDPGLITVRGKALLDAAEVVVYDRLVHPSLWEGKHAIDAGKEPGSHRVDQAAINALLVSLAREGRVVVRLKGGDPFVFGRGAEEAEALAAAGIPFEVVPAPSSAVAALAAAGIPVTDRRHASSVAIVTGHCATGVVDWRGLATSVDTLVVLMGLGHLPEIVGHLLAAGRSGDTPAAVVASGTLPDQRTVVATLSDLPAAVTAAGIRPPGIIVVGDVVTLAEHIGPAARGPGGGHGRVQGGDLDS